MKRIAVVIALTACFGLPQAAQSAPAERSQHYSHLTRADARYWMAVAIQRNFGPTWKYAAGRSLKCKKRINRRRVQCTRVQWTIGDMTWFGTGSIWYTGRGKGTQWNYSYRLTRINEYCAFVQHRPKSECLKRIVVK